MFGVNNLESNPNETPQCSRYETDANDEVFLSNSESTLKKRKVDKAKVKFPRLSSFNMSALRLSSSTNSEISKTGSEGGNFNVDEEMEELRCSPMIQAESPVLTRKKKCGTYNLTPRKPFNVESNMSDKSLHEPLRLSVSINDSISHDELSDSLHLDMEDPEQMKSEKISTPHGLICPPAQCPDRPSKIRKSDASIGGERSCRLLFTKSEDAMKDAITSYGCEAGICVSQTSEKPITPSDFGIELKQGSLDFDVQASGSKTDHKITKDITQEEETTEKVIKNENLDDKLPKGTLDLKLFGMKIDKSDSSAKVEMGHVTSTKFETDQDTLGKVVIEPIKILNNAEHTSSINSKNANGYVNSNSEFVKEKPSPEHGNIDKDYIDNSYKYGSPKSENVLDQAILEHDNKTVFGLSTPILKVDVEYPKILATPTHDQSSSKSNNLISIPLAAPTMSADRHLGHFVSSNVRVLLTPTDSPISNPDSGSSCSCSCTECDFSPPSAARAKIMSQTIESSNDTDSEIQMPQIIDAVMDPITIESKDLKIQENIIESSNKCDIMSTRNESLTSTPKDLTPHSVKSNVTAISGISPLPSSTPRPKHKHKHDHHHHHYHHHHHHRHQSIHHLTVHSNSHHHMTSDGDILITSTPMYRQNLADEPAKEEISTLGSNIDSAISDIYNRQSRFVMSDLCGSDNSVNHYSLSKNMLNGASESSASQKFSNGGGAMYITSAIASGSLDMQDNKELASYSEDNCKLHLGTDVSPEVWMMDESVVLPRRASSVDETLFRVLSQDSPICLSLN